ncbi:hypothetical protein [Flavobacterium weaverense]|uniref:Uncharacterized protein n=1 Tax=Flavobacterium weaverense TaxID=271156 RepID=A0A3M0A5W9_9FLAO|nr:hypothetical protein [Flavobacterium weaverense]RMA77865.1 hypothetical protein BC961_0216 [Flavobacterium weaverense]
MKLTESRKLIIIKLISKFKENDAYTIEITEFNKCVNNISEVKIITEILKYELELMTSISKGTYKLTNKGIIFSFDDIEDKQIKNKLELDNLKLQKEAAEYQQSIRNKEYEIRNLTRDNLRLGNWDIRFRWYIAVISFIIGFIIKYFIN